RETEVGNDRIEATLPAVVAVSDAINEPRYTSLKGMMAAKKKPLDRLTASDLGIGADAVGVTGSQTVVLGVGAPPARAGAVAVDVAAGLAARVDAGINWDLVDLELRDGELVGKQPMLQDSVLAEVGWRSPQRVALFRPGSFEAVPSATEREPAVEALTVTFAEHTLAARVILCTVRADEGTSLSDADVIVAGGIGLGSAEGFDLAEQLAAALGGAVAATRAAVYKGWYPASAQVGQTGKTVSPKLYVALGISGAVQ